ncbi:carboxypeptidase regulatory-like domain-containing protein, partial [Candidatus Sumerlaeota bacterium]|nr:carboxypeptidase regulatory-like domain-containing protein [Candidatus Sumerlaeota bacterium]
MFRKFMGAICGLALLGGATAAWAENGHSLVIKGSVADGAGKPMHGVMITAFDDKEEKNITVFSHDDGKFSLPGVPAHDLRVRARLVGMEDEYQELEAKDVGKAELKFTMKTAEEMQLQRRAFERVGLIPFPNAEQRMNFRMTCGYCHQLGSDGFRAPDQKVDWDVMVTQVMAGPDAQLAFRQLSKENKEFVPQALYDTFHQGAEEKWPAFTPPPAPDGADLDVIITEWPMGHEDAAMMHDLEVGSDGWIYTIDSQNDCLFRLNPKTAEREMYPFPGGKEPFTTDPPIKAPHSIEEDHDGNMWITLCYGKEMARFNEKTHEILQIPSGANGKFGNYPHTLRFDQKNICWYTDAASNSVFRLDPKSLEIKEYKLLKATEAINAPGQTERGIVPYGMSIAPDGMVWYSKLNGNRIGRIDPNTGQITEWKPPVIGPRRHEVAPDGVVWIPGFGSGDFCKYDPKKDEWKTYPLPGGGEEFPYALSVHPQTGEVWICGTESDTLMRFDPKSEKMAAVYRLPTKVTYTREIE